MSIAHLSLHTLLFCSGSDLPVKPLTIILTTRVRPHESLACTLLICQQSVYFNFRYIPPLCPPLAPRHPSLGLPPQFFSLPVLPGSSFKPPVGVHVPATYTTPPGCFRCYAVCKVPWPVHNFSFRSFSQTKLRAQHRCLRISGGRLGVGGALSVNSVTLSQSKHLPQQPDIQVHRHQLPSTIYIRPVHLLSTMKP